MNVPAILIDVADALLFGTPSIILRDDLVRKYDITIAEATALIRAAEREINAIDKASLDKQTALSVLSQALNEYSPLGTAYANISQKIDILKKSIAADEKRRAEANQRISDANTRLDRAYQYKDKSLGQLVTESDEVRNY